MVIQPAPPRDEPSPSGNSNSNSNLSSLPPAAPAVAPASAGGSNTSFSVSNGGPSIVEAPAGLTKLDVTQGAPAIETLAGKVSAAMAGAGTQVVMAAPDLEIRHLVGQAYGAAVSNSANNMTIDTTTIIDIDLSNLPALSIGTTWFSVQNIAIDSATRLGR